ARFRDERSDFIGLLKLWDFVREQDSRSTSQLRRACKEGFLSFIRVREWREGYRQLEDLVREYRVVGGRSRADTPNRVEAPRNQRPQAQSKNAPRADPAEAIHRALLTGLLSRVGQWNSEQRVYIGARQTRFALHPSSGLAKKPPPWVMAFELVETSQLFARTVAKVEPAWLAEVGAHLLKRSYSDPHWSEKSARASVREHSTLFGLTVVRDQSVDYASISPVRARLMFIEHALVRGEYKSRGSFQEKNQRLLEEAARLRDKARQSDMLTDDEVLLEFFDRRIPESVVNGKTFEDWREKAERANPNLLCFSLSHVLAREPGLSPERYPDEIIVRGTALQALYRFDPSAADDGVTLNIPLAVLPQLSPEDLDGTIPAWREQKIEALLEALPRALRKDLGSVSELAARFCAALRSDEGSLLDALSRLVSLEAGVSVLPDVFRTDAIAAHLRFNFRILDERGEVVEESRNLEELLHRHAGRARDAVRRAAPRTEIERAGITSWDFGDLPRSVTRRVLGTELTSFVALADCQTSVAVQLFDTEAAAAAAHREGVRRLLQLATKGALASLAKRVPPPFLRRVGLPSPRAEADAFRDAVLARVISETFELSEVALLPRSKAEFDTLLSAGTSRLPRVFDAVVRLIAEVDTELHTTLRALDDAAKQKNGGGAVPDIRAQIEQLFPAELMQRIELLRLQQYPRYLRAARARLTRAVNDPRKDAAKAAPFAPIWQTFLAKRAKARDPRAAERVHYVLEELRVALFAPELKPAQPVTVATAALAVQSLQ
ncbi:MAG TPA: DUF3418 domain-containing protein, partial [Polyangiaceae bacterium]|nr:DUF3418 domain-containing protein [Polyangiaceae bacterium]